MATQNGTRARPGIPGLRLVLFFFLPATAELIVLIVFSLSRRSPPSSSFVRFDVHETRQSDLILDQSGLVRFRCLHYRVWYIAAVTIGYMINWDDTGNPSQCPQPQVKGKACIGDLSQERV